MLILDNLQIQKGDKKRITVLGSCPEGSYSPIYVLYLLQAFERYILQSLPVLRWISTPKTSLTYISLIINIKNEMLAILLPLMCDKECWPIYPRPPSTCPFPPHLFIAVYPAPRTVLSTLPAVA